MSLLPHHDVEAHNQSQVKTLIRALRLAQGQFSLIFVRCNYSNLRDQILKRLQPQVTGLVTLYLDPDIRNLYRAIEAELALQEVQPEILMVFGLEQVMATDETLDVANRGREAFLNLPFPVVLWVNDLLWRRLNRQAPDFTSWGTTLEFIQTTPDLIQFLTNGVQRILAVVLDAGGNQFIPNDKILGPHSGSELQAAYQDLMQRKVEIDPTLEASLRFVLARYYYAHQQISEALEQYQLSLAFWERSAIASSTSSNNSSQTSPTTVTSLEWQGLLLFHTGLCYVYLAEQHLQHSGQSEWEQARVHLQGCINRFDAANRQDLVAKFIGQLGEALRQLRNWSDLWTLGLRSRHLHQGLPGTDPIQLAQDYGFLAEGALHRGEYWSARELACVALEIIHQTESTADDPFKNQQQALCRLALAQALDHLEMPWEAIEQLELAHGETIAKYSPRLYLKILERLNQLYFKLGDYRAAFDIKTEYRTKSTTFGYTAFIGAGRLRPRERVIDPVLGTVSISRSSFTDAIQASGREETINLLLQRISSPQYKLTVIYGQSGVGKSSILRAGLVPALNQYRVDARTVVPITLRNYNAYFKELDTRLVAAQDPRSQENGFSSQKMVDTQDTDLTAEPLEETLEPDQTVRERVIEQLRQNASQNQITVLIFDQFEEFFFVNRAKPERQVFFSALQDFLNLPFVKVILSLREDYLHYLLECVRYTNLDAINNDILNKDILFYLGNLTPDEAHNVIKRLTDQSHFYLQEALIRELVKDLSSDFGKVRPIELQVVGTQLQTEGITTLGQYHRKGPKQRLVERFLGEVVQDCGPENQQAAQAVLYFLTDENNTRPLKTRNELAEELRSQLSKDVVDQELDLVLYIFEKSGLISCEVSTGATLYQLVHDYLAGFIREQSRSNKIEQFQAVVREKNVYARLAEEQEKIVRQQKIIAQETERRRRLEKYLAASFLVLLLPLMGLAVWQRNQRSRARVEAIEGLTDVLLLAETNDQLGTLQASLNIGQNIQRTTANAEEQRELALGLRTSIRPIQEQNRLEGHDSGVLGIAYSNDGQFLATASNDKTVKLWSPKGELLNTLEHNASVIDVAISSESLIATVTLSPDPQRKPQDNQILLWTQDGQRISTDSPIDHQGEVISRTSFSPDGQTLASAGWDGTVKLWKIDGTLLNTLEGHQREVFDVDFSPDGQMLASSSLDGSVKLWTREGKLLKTLNGHCRSADTMTEDCAVYSVNFSPDGQYLVSASNDRTLNLWDVQQGRVKRTFEGHSDEVFTANFSPDGVTIASGSIDRTVKLWNSRTGILLKTFLGHQNTIREVAFSPDGEVIASGSQDKTTRMWSYNRNPLNDRALYGHTRAVWGADFSPEAGQPLLSTASDDRTARLWQVNAGKPKTDANGNSILLTHNHEVSAAIFDPMGQMIATADIGGIVSSSPPEETDDPNRSETSNNTSTQPVEAFEPGVVKLWDLTGNLAEPIEIYDDYLEGVYALDFSPDGQILAAASQDVQLRNLNDNSVTSLETAQFTWMVQFDPNGNWIVAGTQASNDAVEDEAVVENSTTAIELWQNTDSGWQQSTILTPLEIIDSSPNGLEQTDGINPEINAVGFLPNPVVVEGVTTQEPQLSVAIGQDVFFWDQSKGGSCPIQHSASVRSLSLHPSFPEIPIIVTASFDKQVKFWWVPPEQLWPKNGECQPFMPDYVLNQNTFVESVNFSQDGNDVAIARDDGTAFLWSMQGFELNYQIEQACRWLQDYFATNDNVTDEERDSCVQ